MKLLARMSLLGFANWVTVLSSPLTGTNTISLFWKTEGCFPGLYCMPTMKSKEYYNVQMNPDSFAGDKERYHKQTPNDHMA